MKVWLTILLAALLAGAALLADSGQEPPVIVIKSFEDGSAVWSDGTVTCDPRGTCAR